MKSPHSLHDRPPNKALIFGLISMIGLFCAANSHAILTVIEDSIDDQHCDTLFIPTEVHEIGWGPASGGPFPMPEELSSRDLGPGPPPCVLHDNPQMIDPVVEITNLTGRDLTEVWYVADHDTFLTNWDGFVLSPTGAFAPGVAGAAPGFQLLTFKIDSIGVNTPLIFESMIVDNIWQAGETWEFVIQDYVSGPGLPPSALNSIGLDSPSPAAGSSGSIIAIPEPSGVVLALFGAAAVFLRRRR